MEYLTAVDEPWSTSYFQHVKTYENTFKAADKYAQEAIDSMLDETDDKIFDNDTNDDESVFDSDDLDDDDNSDTSKFCSCISSLPFFKIIIEIKSVVTQKSLLKFSVEDLGTTLYVV